MVNWVWLFNYLFIDCTHNDGKISECQTCIASVDTLVDTFTQWYVNILYDYLYVYIMYVYTCTCMYI